MDKAACVMHGRVSTCCGNRYIAPYAGIGTKFVICTRECYDQWMKTVPKEQYQKIEVRE